MNSTQLATLVITVVFALSINAQTLPTNTGTSNAADTAPVEGSVTNIVLTQTTNENTQATLPARALVRLTLINPLSTKTAVPGEQFPLTVSDDIKINGRIVIPMGTPAIGEIIHAQKAKGFGKAGELLLTVRHIDLNGLKIKMRSFQPLQGNDKTSNALVTSQIPIVGLFAGFMKGGDIEMPAQTQVQAQTSTETLIDLKTNTPNTANNIPGDQK
jgi:hypothetical protein